jgi:hypothetical protein
MLQCSSRCRPVIAVPGWPSIVQLKHCLSIERAHLVILAMFVDVVGPTFLANRERSLLAKLCM